MVGYREGDAFKEDDILTEMFNEHKNKTHDWQFASYFINIKGELKNKFVCQCGKSKWVKERK